MGSVVPIPVCFFSRRNHAFPVRTFQTTVPTRTADKESSLSVGLLPLPPTPLSYLKSRDAAHKTEQRKLKA